MRKTLETRTVSRSKFEFKLRDLRLDLKTQILKFIEMHDGDIDHFEYGHEPGHRAFKIVLKGKKMSRRWDYRQ